VVRESKTLSNIAILFAAITAAALGQQPQAKTSFVTFSSVPSHLYQHWKAYGDRIAKPGAERIVASGTVIRRATPFAAASSPASVTVLIEYPGRARVDEAGKGSASFDVGLTTGNSSAQSTEDVGDMLELLVEDFSDGFFRIATAEGRQRWIGENFRSADVPGRLYDIAEVTFQSSVRGAVTTQVKTYFFDSKTKLLAKVAYRESKTRGLVAVESEFSDWVQVSGQAVPKTLVRREDGVEMLRVSLSQVAITAAASDGSFEGGGK